MNTYWISFAGHEINLGCCMVDADNPEHALERANELGINPGGEAMIYHLESDAIDLMFWEKNKLISREELVSAGYERLGKEGKVYLGPNHPGVTIICADCNQ